MWEIFALISVLYILYMDTCFWIHKIKYMVHCPMYVTVFIKASYLHHLSAWIIDQRATYFRIIGNIVAFRFDTSKMRPFLILKPIVLISYSVLFFSFATVHFNNFILSNEFLFRLTVEATRINLIKKSIRYYLRINTN